MAKLEIHQFPCLSDNYGVLIHDADGGAPRPSTRPTPRPVAAALKAKGWKLTHILTTHHHDDHTGGNLALKAETGCTIIGPRGEAAKIPGIDSRSARATPSVRRARGARARHARAHRRPHHLLDPVGQRGLRRRHAVCHRLRPRHRGQRPDDVGVAREADRAAEGDGRSIAATSTRRPTPSSRSPSSPTTRRLQKRAKEVDALRAAGKPTLPTRMDLELETNPFLRPHVPAIQQRLGMVGARLADLRRNPRAQEPRLEFHLPVFGVVERRQHTSMQFVCVRLFVSSSTA